MRTGHTIQEKLNVLQKAYICKKDICVLYDCGYKKATMIFDRFKRHYEQKGNTLYGMKIPTSEFLIFVNYDEKRVIRYARLENSNV